MHITDLALPDTLLVQYDSYVDRSYEPPRSVGRTLLVLPQGVSPLEQTTEETLKDAGIVYDVLRRAYMPISRDGRRIIRADIPLVEGWISVERREKAALALGATVCVLGEDLAANVAGAA